MKIKTTTVDERSDTLTSVVGNKIDYYTYADSDKVSIKYVLKGLPPSFDESSITSVLTEKGVQLINTRPLRCSTYDDMTNMKVVRLLPILVLTMSRSPEMTTKLKSITGIYHIKIKLENYED